MSCALALVRCKSTNGKESNKLQYLERNPTRLSWFSCGSSILVELEFEDVGFCGGRKTGEQTNSTQGPESNPDPIGGSPLRHPCSVPCFQSEIQIVSISISTRLHHFSGGWSRHCKSNLVFLSVLQEGESQWRHSWLPRLNDLTFTVPLRVPAILQLSK